MYIFCAVASHSWVWTPCSCIPSKGKNTYVCLLDNHHLYLVHHYLIQDAQVLTGLDTVVIACISICLSLQTLIRQTLAVGGACHMWVRSGTILLSGSRHPTAALQNGCTLSGQAAGDNGWVTEQTNELSMPRYPHDYGARVLVLLPVHSKQIEPLSKSASCSLDRDAVLPNQPQKQITQ